MALSNQLFAILGLSLPTWLLTSARHARGLRSSGGMDVERSLRTWSEQTTGVTGIGGSSCIRTNTRHRPSFPLSAAIIHSSVAHRSPPTVSSLIHYHGDGGDALGTTCLWCPVVLNISADSNSIKQIFDPPVYLVKLRQTEVSQIIKDRVKRSRETRQPWPPLQPVDCSLYFIHIPIIFISIRDQH